MSQRGPMWHGRGAVEFSASHLAATPAAKQAWVVTPAPELLIRIIRQSNKRDATCLCHSSTTASSALGAHRYDIPGSLPHNTSPLGFRLSAFPGIPSVADPDLEMLTTLHEFIGLMKRRNYC